MCARNYPRQQLIWKIPLWSADGKLSAAALQYYLLTLGIRRSAWRSLAKNAQNFASGLPASLPLSLTPAKRLNLELAKGFEPLTL